MNFYNIVLLPPDNLRLKIIDFAQNNFSDKANGYCLSQDVFPHITLCQFKSENLPDLELNEINKTPIFDKLFIRDGQGQHEGFCWVQILVQPEDWIVHLQKYIVQKLSSYDVEILTKNYSPHLTLCRVEDEVREKFFLPDCILESQNGWVLGSGQSDENGQYLGNKT